MTSYGLAVQLADEWEKELRAYKQRHPDRKAVTEFLEDLMDRQAIRAGAPDHGMWNHRDVANKTCEILRERLGE
jgi:aspartate/tyrosine/aromatic aminotransferase